MKLSNVLLTFILSLVLVQAQAAPPLAPNTGGGPLAPGSAGSGTTNPPGGSDGDLQIKNGSSFSGTRDVSAMNVQAAAGDTLRTLADHLSNQYNAVSFGAKCDGVELTDVSTTATSNVVSSASYTFSTGDIGKVVHLNSGVNYVDLGSGTITGVGTGPDAGKAILSFTSSFTSGARRLIMYKTDDTANIQQGIDYAASKNGGRLVLPTGVCAVSGLNLKRQVILTGQGRNSTVLYLISNSNKSVVKTENFDALTGTGLNYGPTGTFNGIVSDPRVPSWFGLKDLRIDGNRARQTVAGDCFTSFGNALVIDSVFLHHCSANGLYTEASGGYSYSQHDWKGQEEGFINDLVVRNVGKNGWHHRGPHDSIITSYLVYDWGKTGTGYYGLRNESAGVTYSGSSHWWHLHAYTSAGGDYKNFLMGAGGDVQFLYSDFGVTDITSNNLKINTLYLLQCGVGAATPCVNITGDFNAIGNLNYTWMSNGTLPTNLTMLSIPVGADGNTVNITGSSVQSTTANNTTVSVKGNFNHVSGSVSNAVGSGNTCVDLGGSYNYFNFQSFSCTTHLKYNSGGFHNEVHMRSYRVGSEVDLVGTINSSDLFFFDGTENRFMNTALGTASSPSLTFGGYTTNGLFGSSNSVGVSIADTQVGLFNSSGLTLAGALVANSASLTTPLPVASGGTGANTAGAARTSLGLGSVSLLSSVDLTANVTGVLPVVNGGTGTATPGLIAGTNVSITGTFPNQTISASGGGGGGSSSVVSTSVVTITTSTSLTASNHMVVCDATSGAVTITLPSAASVCSAGVCSEFVVKKKDSTPNTCFVKVTGGATKIDDVFTLPITAQFGSKAVQSDGTQYWQK